MSDLFIYLVICVASVTCLVGIHRLMVHTTMLEYQKGMDLLCGSAFTIIVSCLALALY